MSASRYLRMTPMISFLHTAVPPPSADVRGVATGIATIMSSPFSRPCPYRCGKTRRLMPLTTSTPVGPISLEAPVTGSSS